MQVGSFFIKVTACNSWPTII